MGLNAKLANYVKQLDKYLQKPFLNRITLQDADKAIALIEEFYALAETLKAEPVYSLENETYIAAGCRLCADLSEAVQEKIWDAQYRAHQSLVTIYRLFRRDLQQHLQSQAMMGRIQRVRAKTVDVGRESGLGMVL